MRPWRRIWARKGGAWSWSCVKEANTAKMDSFLSLSGSLEKARSLTSRKILVRLDSAHDALDTRVALAGQKNVSYIIKWNPRREDQLEWAARIFKEGEVTIPRDGKRVGLLTVYIQQVHKGKTYRFKRVMRAVERTIDRRGQRLLTPEIEVEGWWTTLDLPAKRCDQALRGSWHKRAVPF